MQFIEPKEEIYTRRALTFVAVVNTVAIAVLTYLHYHTTIAQ